MGLRNGRALRGIAIGALLLALCSSSAGLADTGCWCARFEELADGIPTRSPSLLLGLGVTAATSALSIWSVDLLGLSHPEWFKAGAVVSGVSSAASSLVGLVLPSRRDIKRDVDFAAGIGLNADLVCAEALAGHADAVRTHRYLSGLIDLGTGVTHILLLSPYGTYARGDVWDYLYLASGIVKMLFGLADLALPTSFERDYADAVLQCGVP